MSFSAEYIKQIIEKRKTGQAKEHAYRPALEHFFEAITDLNVVNDPKRSEFGAPDFVFMKNKMTVAYAEAKDIGVSLNEVEKSEQMIRYFGYSNLILTDYLEFRFFRNGEPYGEPIKIAEIKDKNIEPIENNFTLAEDTIKEFIKEAKEPIKSGALLAKVMAGKARRIRDNIKTFLKSGDEQKNADLLSVYNVIKQLLLIDLDYDKFADMYAQTVIYGLFVARYHDDDSPGDFSRSEARDLVPASNPFLRHFFDHIAGTSFDKRIEFIVNELCEEFTHADVKAIVHDYYKTEKDNSRDPIIHFYEDFLKEYDSASRIALGVFYTPLPVVNFIVRAIDEILKKDLNLKGLADSSKIEITRETQNKKTKQSLHKVQILDPATGTGTFLNEVILHIKNQFAGQEGRWLNYVKEDLLPRLHGFELMMASYTIAHLKLSATLAESGADIDGARLGIYLTNALEKEERPKIDLWNWQLGLEKALTEESKEANRIKNDLPIMVILGNPPYNVSSQNKSEWINGLIKDYKAGLGERKINLDDDYIKFIRFSEYLIEKNGEGVIGMITNNSYIDGITHRQMRKHLLETFDDIYIFDLHGNAKKKETAPDGGKDENVFAIQQGVAISIFVRKSGKKKGLGNVWHSELFGKQKSKFQALNDSELTKIKWKKIDYKEPYYFFVPKDFSLEKEYNNGLKIDELFKKFSSGIETQKDDLNIFFNKKDAEKVLTDFQNLSESELLKKYNIKDGRDWKIKTAKKDAIQNNILTDKIQYRPFDIRFTNYTGVTKGITAYPRSEVMENFINENMAILTCKRQTSFDFQHVFITNMISERCSVSLQTGEVGYTFPLYLYSEDGVKIPNFNQEIYKKIVAGIKSKVEPENVMDYIYAVLHSPSYRKKYKEFLKINFPRVPYPQDEKQFFTLAKLGEELRHLHLLESLKLSQFITTYPEAGDDVVEKIIFKDGKAYINKTQYFGGVPEEVWNFYIGGYQPAQKWLKDRKGRNLSNADIEHYQKMIVAISETIKIMKEIDKNGID
jgi:predicted helicase